MAVVFGFAIGNYACSLVHRLPRGRLILDQKPYCGSCKASLQTKDLFPVISALLLRHRCRYCGTSYPVSHTWTEALVGALFVLAFFKYNFSEQFMLVATIGVFLITLAAIEANERMVMGKVLMCVVVFGMINRVLVDGTIYGFAAGGFYGLILGAVLFFKGIKPVAHIFKLPVPAELLTVGGICAGIAGLPVFALCFMAFYVLLWCVTKLTGSGKKIALTVPFGLAVMVPVLYPELTLSLLWQAVR
jgi:prepilin signal peptidase PulO-like enzyme (type II secretory pathway)